MGEAKTVCHLCKREPGTRHKKSCPKHKNYSIPQAWRKMRDKPYKPRWPIADIYDCVAGPLKLVPIPRGTPMRVQL